MEMIVEYGIEADHPRACGENQHYGHISVVDYGSPPRMRGKLVIRGFGGSLGRITPAHAGKTR